jgi:flavin reductase (DIM6/NTAB) family NADH-FMN oxidoreductase RutF
MSKVRLENNTFVYPMPVTLLGTLVQGKPNFMALGWVTRVNASPPLIGCGVGNHHLTSRGIQETRTFSINFPSREMIVRTDYCGLVSGLKEDKSALFEIFYGDTGTAPMIRECPLSLECRLTGAQEYATNTFFTGEITGAYADPSVLSEGRPDIRKMDPLLLTMPDNMYWTVGEPAGKAWNIGKTLKKREKP